jgi:hypothetical protein
MLDRGIRKPSRRWLGFPIRFGILLTVCSAWGCTPRTDLMDYAPKPGFDIQAPRPGNALILFFRPGRMAGVASSSVFDDVDLVAVLMDSTYTAYETTPGKHRFMVLGEAADFMDADLAENKVYCATVVPRFGVWVARFSLKTITPQDPEWKEVREWISDSSLVTLNSQGRSWAQENTASILEKHDAYLAKWLEKDPGDQPSLYPDDGVPFGDMPWTVH